MKKENRGGKRSNAGRKPIADKKIPVYIFPQTSVVIKLGGKGNVQDIALQAVEKEYKKSLKIVWKNFGEIKASRIFDKSKQKSNQIKNPNNDPIHPIPYRSNNNDFTSKKEDMKHKTRIGRLLVSER